MPRSILIIFYDILMYFSTNYEKQQSLKLTYTASGPGTLLGVDYVEREQRAQQFFRRCLGIVPKTIPQH